MGAVRNEDQISTVFRSTELSNITLKLQLDNNYLPDDDNRLFLNDSFDDIKNTHLLPTCPTKTGPRSMK